MFVGDCNLYSEGLHCLEPFACREFPVGHFQISEFLEDVQNMKGAILQLSIASFSCKETLLIYSFISPLSETLNA